jgi:hypothetical protein
MKPLEYTLHEWNKIWKKLKRDYPPSVYLIRSNMKKVLGFTVREHQYFDKDNLWYTSKIMLDFYQESHRSMFLLKYGNLD